MTKKFLVLLTLCFLAVMACKKKTDAPGGGGVITYPGPTAAEEAASSVITDCAVSGGKMIYIEGANGMSTSSPIPGPASLALLQAMKAHVTRVWIQLVFVYNNGTIDWNYKYGSSGVGVEDALTFYSTTTDSLLICLSGHKNSGSSLVPATAAAYKDFVRDLLLHYKRKYPKIKYIEASNEPDFGGETMATYYPVYQYYYQGLNEANQVLKQENIGLGLSYAPMLLSNAPFTSNIPGMLTYAKTFFTSYAADTDPNKKLDFFSFHSYGESNRPLELLTARQRIDSAIRSHNLPIIPVFLSEYGQVGGSTFPSGFTETQTVTMQPAGQITKAFYLYEGGCDQVMNWLIYHSTINYKSEILDIQNGYASPYGNSLLLCKKLSDMDSRVKADSKVLDNLGLGIHALATKSATKGIALLVWNFNWTNAVPDKDIQVMVKNIPKDYFGTNKIHSKIYVIDSQNNNFFINPAQNSLAVTTQQDYDYQSYLKIPVKLERNSVVLIQLTP